MALGLDVRFALRSLRRSPVYASVAILSLAVGIAANLTVFSLVNTLLLRPLPVSKPEQLIRLGRTTLDVRFGTVSVPEFTELRSELKAKIDLVAQFPSDGILRIANEPRHAWLELVSGNYFGTLGVRPALGRGFVPEEDASPTGPAAIVVSHAMWLSRLGGDSSVIGRAIHVNGHPFTVVGVAPAGFHGSFTGFDIDAWVPTSTQQLAIPSAGSSERREDRFLMVFGRLRRGVTPDQLRSTLGTLANRLRLAQADTTQRVRLEMASARGVHPFIAGIVAAFLGLLQGVMLLVLLIACVNLANILLVRTSARRRELAVRAALGASRWRIAQLLFAESVLVAIAGGAIGVAATLWITRLLERLDFNVGIPLALTLDIDLRVLLTGLFLTMVTVVGFGVGPTLAASRSRSTLDLRIGGATTDRKRSRVRALLVAAQVTVASVLLVGSTLMLRSLARTTTMSPGFDAARVELFSASPEMLGYDESRGYALWEAIVDRVSRLPHVEGVTLALMVPLGSRGDAMSMAPADKRRQSELTGYNMVRSGYFHTLRIQVVDGREFLPSDKKGTPDVAVISEAMARRYFAGTSAIGRAIQITDRAGGSRSVTVVGVVRDVKTRFLGESSRPFAYLPIGQWYRSDMVLHVRRAPGVSPDDLRKRITAEIHQLEPNLAVDAESMERATSFSLIPLRVAATVLGFAGVVGLLLASMGVFGLVAYAVSLRTREIGIRMALGAGPAAVVRLVAMQGLRPVVVGLVTGLAVSLVAGQLLRGLLVSIGPNDPTSMLVVSVVLFSAAAAALFMPVRRAIRVDPTTSLRAE